MNNYVYHDRIHNLDAPRQIVPIVIDLIKPSSVLDVGCGIGTWLKVFDEKGVSDYTGIDGNNVNKNLLMIPLNRFIARDLTASWSLNRKFDLVISLEVGEHLTEESADRYVKALVEHGEIILFSAAIPGQGGQNHINEQWPEYWEKKFNNYGLFFHDCIRPLIWKNNNVEWWYKQNIFLLKKEKPNLDSVRPMSIVHPELHELIINNHKQYCESLKSGKQGLKISIQIFINALIFKLKSFLKAK